MITMPGTKYPSHMTPAMFQDNPALVTENITLTDLIHIEELQQIQNICAETFGIASVITTPDGHPITQSSNFSKVCVLIRTSAKGAKNCRKSSQALGQKAHSHQKPMYEQCLSCGFIDASAPIVVSGKHLGNWMFGQIRHDGITEQSIRQYATEIDVCPDTLSAAFVQTHSIPIERFANSIQLIWLLAQKISTLAYTNLLLMRDNHNLLRAEEAIKCLNKDLENRIWEYEAANSELQKTLVTLQQTQTQLIQREKLASLGNLVAGIAHEINTPVGVGVTAASYLEMQTKTIYEMFKTGTMKRSDFDSYMATALEATTIVLLNLQRASELIASFKQVAVDQVSEARQTFRIRQYIDAIILSLQPNIRKFDPIISIECDEKLELDSFPGAFSQIITNLIMNSMLHAYPDGEQGCITISVKAEPTELVLLYSDDGVGIPEQHLDRIFEPFFTTRRNSGGTGLGLHVLYNLVTQTLKGTIQCKSRTGLGTTFIITLPYYLGGNSDDTNTPI